MTLTEVFAATVLVVTLSVTMDLIIRTIRRHRQKQHIKAHAEAVEIADEYLERVFGIVRAEPVELADIKYGEHIFWGNDDHTVQKNYVAGFDGDPGPSTEGHHVRPINRGGHKK